MFIRSTGLGRTLLTARVAKIETTEVVPSTLETPKEGAAEPMRMLMVMQVVDPVNWTVRAFVDPSDLRHMAKVVLTNPMLILKGIKFFFSKDPVYGTPATAEKAAAPAPGPAAAKAATPGPKTGPGPFQVRRHLEAGPVLFQREDNEEATLMAQKIRRNQGGLMPDKKYDAVIVGGGHHATIIACYLARAGLKTAMFERWHEMGGGACGEELPLPGYIQNVCAHFTRFYAHPAYAGFQPERLRAGLYVPGVQRGLDLSGRQLHPRQDNLSRGGSNVTGKTEFDPEAADFVVKQVAKINKDDANTVEEMIRRYHAKWRAAYHKYRFTGPAEWPEGPDPLEALANDPKDGLEPDIAFGTVGHIATKLFKSPEMQTFYMRAMQTSNGFFPQDRPGPYWHIHVLGLVLSMDGAAIVTGGTHTITHALLRAFEEYGGEFFVLSEVKRVLVDNNKAYGIELTNGERILADVVVSDLNTELTIDAAGKESWPPEIWAKGQKLKEKPVNIYDDKGYERTQLFWGNIALMEAPVYPQNPQLGYVPRLYFGKADPEYFLSGRYQKERWELGIANQALSSRCPRCAVGPDQGTCGPFYCASRRNSRARGGTSVSVTG